MALVLIVDDAAMNRQLLHAYLEGSGHELVEAESGEAALAIAQERRPDLVLLDVMMPGLSGFETTARLKAMMGDQFVPVVLITALNDQSARLKGLRAGADEFLTKPVDRHELSIRIAHLLALREKEMALHRRNEELVELQRFREEMSQVIVHDLKNPLAVMLSNIDYVTQDRGDDADLVEALGDCKEAGNRALRLLANLLDTVKMESGRLQPQRSSTTVSALIDPLVQHRTHLIASRGISVSKVIDPAAQLNVDVDLIGRVTENLLDNAVRYTPAGGRIAVLAESGSKSIQLRFGNSGAAIPVEARARIFEKFGQASSTVGRMNLGLGLYFCRMAVEAHQGSMWIEETRELPTVFALEFPA